MGFEAAGGNVFLSLANGSKGLELLDYFGQ
jgi:hypothetical protein